MTTKQEALSGILKLKAQPYKGNIHNLGDGDDTEIFEEMIHFFYNLKLSPKGDSVDWDWGPNPSSAPLVYLARVYVLAEKYFVEGLKACMLRSFRSWLDRSLESPELTKACLIIFKKTVEPGGEEGLKTEVAQRLAANYGKIKDSAVHDALLQEIPELAFRVLKAMPEPAPRSCPCSRDVTWGPFY